VAVTTRGVQRHDAKGFSYRFRAGATARAVEAHRFHLRAEPQDAVLLVSDRGRAWWGAVGRLPREAGFADLGLEKGEQIVGGGVLTKECYLVLGSRAGQVKRVKGEDVRTGAEASWSAVIGLAGAEDRVLFAAVAGEKAQVMFFTNGRANRFAAAEVNPQATPSARGVAGIKVPAEERLLGGAVIADPAAKLALVVATAAGYLKRVALEQFPVQGRAGQGVQLFLPTKTTGPVVAVGIGPLEGTVDLIGADEKRQRLDEVPLLGRASPGKKLGELEGIAEIRVFRL